MEANLRHQDTVVLERILVVMVNIISQFIIKKKSNALLTTNSNTVTYSEVIVSVEVVKCRILIDADAGFSYIYLKFISLINKKPVLTRNRNNKSQ